MQVSELRHLFNVMFSAACPDRTLYIESSDGEYVHVEAAHIVSRPLRDGSYILVLTTELGLSPNDSIITL
jgi:hypothetical protein